MFNINDTIRMDGVEIYIKDILEFSYYDEQSGYKRFNKNEYTIYNLHEFYNIVKCKYKSSMCYIGGVGFKVYLSNGILHSLDTSAYEYYENELYFIEGRLFSKTTWQNHPSVIKHNRLKKLNNIFLMNESI